MFAPLIPLLISASTWLAGFLGRAVLIMAITAAIEFIPRLLGLGQGLFTWGMSAMAQGAFSAFRYAFGAVGLTIPSFNTMLNGLPSEIVAIGSMMRIHRVIFIIVSIPIFNLVRDVATKVAQAGTTAVNAATLMSKGAK